ncbi:MFS transporter [Pleomorphovibrio marinus]|uniref:MFS transporter n=1 Tax=Pleomorphovibrio marinus TaxID=2164132 RepID=UPI000E0C9316|nr:MFS transporter [Pleomorphovibrio marinus]
MTLSQIVFRFRVATMLYWAMSGSFLCYYVIFFEEQKGISPADIGIMMSIYTLSALIGQNFFGYLSDKLQSLKKSVLFAVLIMVIVVPTFPLHNHLYLIYPSMALVGFMQQPLGPMLDSWMLKLLATHNKENIYGKIRGVGSMGWATAGPVTAYLMQHVGWDMMYVVSSTCGISLAFVVWGIKDVQKSNEQVIQLAKDLTPLKTIRKLFQIKPYLFILLVVFFNYLGVQTSYNFLSLIMRDTGGSLEILGWTYFLDAGSELPAMFISVWLLSRFPPKRLMMVAVILYLIRFGLILYFQTPIVVSLTSILEGFAFGFMLASLRNYIFTIAPRHLQTSALTICDAVFLSMSVIVGGTLGGWVIQEYSVMTLMWCCMGSSTVALLLLLIPQRTGSSSSASEPSAS